jgi:hypothetical protein
VIANFSFMNDAHLRMSGRDRLTPVLLDPSEIVEWGDEDWDLAVRQARRAGLLARVDILLSGAEMAASVPPAPRAQLQAARVVVAKHRDDVAREIRAIAAALGSLDAPLLLLKGAAYAAAGLPPAAGRLFGDIDILVPKESLTETEALLVAAGWNSANSDAYDQRYYREWMHELPPLQHERRQTAIDVHHTIVPPTSRFAVDAKRLRDAAIPAGADSRILVLAPADMVLHSAVHLFTEGEFSHGLRDLADLDLLLRHFADRDPHFWDILAERAQSFGLVRPLHYAVRFAAALLATPVPPRLLTIGAPGPVGGHVMDALFARALRPPHPSCADRFTALALFFLYIRAHYLRMPLGLLMPHLLRKALVRRVEPATA